MSVDQIIAIAVFVIVMGAVISEKIHRALAAGTGALALLLLGILNGEQGLGYIDFNTIGVITGMMFFVAVVKNSGLFEYVAIKASKLAKGSPTRIMLYFMVVTAVLSAFLDNVTTVLLIGPMTITICRMLELSPVPFFMTQILSSNIGGTATLIGDPPNIMIGSKAGLSFMDFIEVNAPVIVIILVATMVCFHFLYKKQLIVSEAAQRQIMLLDEKKSIRDRVLFKKSLVMIVFVILGFMFHGNLGVESGEVALLAAVIMLLIGRQDMEDMIANIEWSTILFFAGLFVVVGGLVQTGVIDALASLLMGITQGRLVMTMIILLWVSAIFSSFLDNIPFVATLIPLITTMQQDGMDVYSLWWAISLGACLGGNGTLIGASANVVLSGISNRHGHAITFISYLKIGFPMMLLSIAIATVYLLLRF